MTTPIDDVLDDLVAEYDRLESILDVADRRAVAQRVGRAGLDGHRRDDPPRADRGSASSARRRDRTSRIDSTAEAARSTIGSIDKSLPNATSRPSSSRAGRPRGRASVEALRAADPGRALRVGPHTAEAADARDDSARRALGARARRDRAVRHPAARHRQTAPHRVARAQHAALRLRASTARRRTRCTSSSPRPTARRCGDTGLPMPSRRSQASAGAFCRVGAQRLAPDASGLVTTGPHAEAALRVLRNYAG